MADDGYQIHLDKFIELLGYSGSWTTPLELSEFLALLETIKLEEFKIDSSYWRLVAAKHGIREQLADRDTLQEQFGAIPDLDAKLLSIIGCPWDEPYPIPGLNQQEHDAFFSTIFRAVKCLAVLPVARRKEILRTLFQDEKNDSVRSWVLYMLSLDMDRNDLPWLMSMPDKLNRCSMFIRVWVLSRIGNEETWHFLKDLFPDTIYDDPPWIFESEIYSCIHLARCLSEVANDEFVEILMLLHQTKYYKPEGESERHRVSDDLTSEIGRIRGRFMQGRDDRGYFLALASSSPAARRLAAGRLAHVRTMDGFIHLVEVLADEVITVRREAIFSIGKQTRWHALPLIAPYLTDETQPEYLRIAAAVILAWMDFPETIRILDSVLPGLEEGFLREKVIDSKKELLEKERSFTGGRGVAGLMGRAVGMASFVLGPGASLLGDLMEPLPDGTEIEFLRSLRDYHGQGMASLLIRLAKHENAAVRAEAVEAITRARLPALGDLLTRALKDKSIDVRFGAALGILGIGTIQEAVTVIDMSINDVAWQVRWATAYAVMHSNFRKEPVFQDFLRVLHRDADIRVSRFSSRGLVDARE